MATNYPGSLDNWSNPTSTTPVGASGYYHDVAHSDAIDAIEAIESELGTSPSVSFSSVKTRLAELPYYQPLAWPYPGAYYKGAPLTAPANNFSASANTLYYQPYYSHAEVAVTKIAFNAFSGSGNARVGIYSSTWSSGYLQPSSLIADAGTASLGTTGLKEVATSGTFLENTWYYLAIVTSATATLWGILPADTFFRCSALAATPSEFLRGCFSQSHTYGALPSSPGTLSDHKASGNFPLMVTLDTAI